MFPTSLLGAPAGWGTEDVRIRSVLARSVAVGRALEPGVCRRQATAGGLGRGARLQHRSGGVSLARPTLYRPYHLFESRPFGREGVAGPRRKRRYHRLLDQADAAEVVESLGKGGGIAAAGGPAQLVESRWSAEQAPDDVERPLRLQEIYRLVYWTRLTLIGHPENSSTWPGNVCFWPTSSAFPHDRTGIPELQYHLGRYRKRGWPRRRWAARSGVWPTLQVRPVNGPAGFGPGRLHASCCRHRHNVATATFMNRRGAALAATVTAGRRPPPALRATRLRLLSSGRARPRSAAALPRPTPCRPPR
jgi:hypothetical protein